MDAADADVGDFDARRAPLSASRRAASTPKPSSPRKMLPTPATRVRGRGAGPLVMGHLTLHDADLVGLEVEIPALFAADVGAGIVLEGDRDVHTAVDVVQDRLDQGAPAGDEQVLGVGVARPGPQHDAAARPHLPSVDQDVITGGIRRRRRAPGSHQGVSCRTNPSSPKTPDAPAPVPNPGTSGAGERGADTPGVATSRRLRTAPCSRSSISAGIDSVRSITAPPGRRCLWPRASPRR
ncbi:hypothetical protein SHIRM173S_11421 [Streptomyces hirsutus]